MHLISLHSFSNGDRGSERTTDPAWDWEIVPGKCRGSGYQGVYPTRLYSCFIRKPGNTLQQGSTTIVNMNGTMKNTSKVFIRFQHLQNIIETLLKAVSINIS